MQEDFLLEEVILVNLAGAGVADKRWDAKRKREILESRIQSIQTLYNAIERKQIQVRYFISASAIGYYGETIEPCDERSAGDESFLSKTCQLWEAAAFKMQELSIPVAIVRVGIVLGKQSGAFQELAKPLQFGIAAIPSDGKQVYSWIHIDDIAGIFYFLSKHKITGIFNGVAPKPATVNTLFDAMKRFATRYFITMHIPSFVIKMIVGEMAVEVLKSCIVRSDKIQQQGFAFTFPSTEEAIQNIMQRK